MSGVIYLVNDDGQLEAMNESQYDSEDLLQRLLADHADLLAGEQINAATPRRWLLLAREAALPDTEGGAGRWSVDHLFVDQDGVPTIVEVKRSTDTRIRREVVGQMLDYAANAVVYWPVEHVRAQFEASCQARDADPELVIREALGFEDSSGSTEPFWQTVKTNLQAGRVRLVFVSDLIPSELRRVVEFLNGQMNPAEVLAVEIKQYVGEGRRALVPRVIGQTQQASALKSAGAHPPQVWDETGFLSTMQDRHGAAAAAIARALISWTRDRGLEDQWGGGVADRSFKPKLLLGSKQQPLFIVYSYPRASNIGVQFGSMARTAPFSDIEMRRTILERLNRIPGVQISDDALSKYPSLPLDALASNDTLTAFLATFDWVVEEFRASNQGRR